MHQLLKPWSMSNGSMTMSYGVHKVTPVHGMWDNSKLFVTLQQCQTTVNVNTIDLVHNFIIPANC